MGRPCKISAGETIEKRPAKVTTIKGVPSEDTSFLRMNATEYLAYLRHEKKGKKKEKKEETD